MRKGIAMKPHVKTSSRFRMWYLRLMRRYSIECKRMTPVFIIGGTVLYATVWVLRAA